MTLQARPTTYNGIPMRSRLEATFAGNMDRWNYEWQYEPRAYGSRNGQYLPDFILSIGGKPRTIVELKGEMVEDLTTTFARMSVVWDSDPSVFLALIEAEAIRGEHFRRNMGWPRNSFLFTWKELADSGHPALPAVFGVCPCGTVGIRIVGNGELVLSCRGCGDERGAVAFLDPTSYHA